MSILAYLHETDIFCDEDTTSYRYDVKSQAIDMTGIQHHQIFRKVAPFLASVAENEIYHAQNPDLLYWKGKGQKFTLQLLSELQRYARHQYPFDQPVDPKLGVMHWWRSIIRRDSAKILPVSGILSNIIMVLVLTLLVALGSEGICCTN